MKRDLKAVVKDYDGKARFRPVMEYDEQGLPVILDKKTGQQAFSHYEPMTLRTYALDALAGRWRGEDNMTNKELWDRKKVHDKIAFAPDGVADLDPADMTMILDALNKQGRDAIVLGAMQELFAKDPEDTPAPG